MEIAARDAQLQGGNGLTPAVKSQEVSSSRKLVFHNTGGGLSWSQQVVGTTALHNIIVGDIDADGDFDIFGTRCCGGSRVVEMWRSDLVNDTESPTVILTAPVNGSVISGIITVSASASDNVGVAGVQFELDGINLGAEDTSAPYEISWNTTTIANGTYTLTAIAKDAAGNTTTSSLITVTVDNLADIIPPTAPTNLVANAISSTQINLSWTASTDNVGVTEYIVFRDGVQLGSSATTSFQDFNLIPATIYSYTVSARDAAGNDSPVSIAVNAATPPRRFSYQQCAIFFNYNLKCGDYLDHRSARN